MVRRAFTRQTRWYQNRCSTFKKRILSSKTRFGKFWNFDRWRPQFWPEPKNDRNDFEMIFRELSNAAFRFSLRRPGAEIMGGGVQTPPPPAGGGKSRGPAGRGLKYCSSWEAVNQEVKRVKQMLTNNGYPISMIDDITRKTISKHFSQTEDNDQSTSGTTHRLYFKNQMSPAYKADENALKTIIHRNCKPAQQNDKLELRIHYISPKTSSLIMTNNITRDKAPLSQTNVVYQFKCDKEECALLPGSTYIGKTVDTLNHRLQNHKYKGAPEQHTEEHHTEPLTQKQLRESTTILCSTRDRRRLGALEGAYIRHRNPDINRQYKFKVYLSLFNGPRLT